MLLLLVLSLAGQVDTNPKFPPLKVYSHACEITEEYDEIRDLSTLEVDLGSIYNKGDHEIECKFAFVFTGKDRQAAKLGDKVRIHFVSTSDTWELLKHHSLHLLYDGNRFTDLDNDHDGETMRGGVIEQFMIRMPMSSFLNMISSNDIKGELGSHEFGFTGQQKTSLMDFASRLGVDSKAAQAIARQQAQAASDRTKAIRDAWDEVLNNARKAAQKLPTKKPQLRQRAYHRVIEEGKASVCKEFNITLGQLKAVATGRESD